MYCRFAVASNTMLKLSNVLYNLSHDAATKLRQVAQHIALDAATSDLSYNFITSAVVRRQECYRTLVAALLLLQYNVRSCYIVNTELDSASCITCTLQ